MYILLIIHFANKVLHFLKFKYMKMASWAHIFNSTLSSNLFDTIEKRFRKAQKSARKKRKKIKKQRIGKDKEFNAGVSGTK